MPSLHGLLLLRCCPTLLLLYSQLAKYTFNYFLCQKVFYLLCTRATRGQPMGLNQAPPATAPAVISLNAASAVARAWSDPPKSQSPGPPSTSVGRPGETPPPPRALAPQA